MDFGIVNPERATALYTAFQLLREVAAKCDAEITIEQEDWLPEASSIAIIGNRVMFDNEKVFTDVASVASNFEVYARTDGKICMSFTFYGMVVWADGGESDEK